MSNFFILMIVLLSSCSDDAERQEQILKLRALGVEQTPLVALPGSTVEVKYYLAGPQGMNLTAASFTDAAFKYGSAIESTLIDAAPIETKYNGISVYTLRANFTIPTETTTLKLTGGVGRIRFGAKFNTTQDDETIVGDTLVYPASTSSSLWTQPTITIENPTTDEISSTSSLSAKTASTNAEGNRVSWFVSSGKVKNRRGAVTEWSEVAAGEQTLILTVRGSKSGSFAIATKKVTVK